MRDNTIRICAMRAVAGAVSILSIIGFTSGPAAAATKLEQARVTKAVNDVKLLPQDRSPVPAKTGNVINSRTGLQTGMRSRAELEFDDESIVRLGSNSIFGFNAGEREVELKQGNALLQIPKGRGTTTIKSLPITAAITGTTILFECSGQQVDDRGRETKPGIVKLIVLEGSLEWSFNANPRKKLKMRSGDMVAFPTNARKFPRKVKVDLARIKDTSLLFGGGGGMGDLPDMATVDREITVQNKQAGDAGTPTRGFLTKTLKPDNADNRVSEVNAIERGGPIVRMIRQIVTPSDAGDAPSAPVLDTVVIPTRPDRCPQDSLDHLCQMPGFGVGTAN